MISASDILPAVEAYLAATGIAPTRFGRRAGVSGRIVFELRKGSGIQQKTADRLNAFMRGDPDGICAGKPRKKYSIHNRVKNAGLPSGPVIILDRTPCFKCGVRADLGCRHQPKSAAIRIEP